MSPKAPSPSALRALRSLISPSQTTPICPYRPFSSSHHPSLPPPVAPKPRNKFAPKTHDRGPTSSEDTQTDFGAMDIFNTSAVSAPATSIDACTSDGFHLNNNVKITGYDGCLLLGGEAFAWSPQKSSSMSEGAASLVDARGVFELPEESLGVLRTMNPKPDLLLLGTGAKLWMLGKKTRGYLNGVLGCRVDVMDTANASSAYNLLAQERGVEGGSSVGAILLPLGWKGR